MRKTNSIGLRLDSLEARETPSGNDILNLNTQTTVPAMAPQEPTIIEPDFQIILPPR